MMSRFTRFALIATLLLGVAACTSKPVMNIENRTPTSTVRSEDDMRRAILAALQSRQWTVERADRGNIMAFIQRRNHQAEITRPRSPFPIARRAIRSAIATARTSVTRTARSTATTTSGFIIWIAASSRN